MKDILFVCATSSELKVLKHELKKQSIKNIKINFLLLKIWNYNTIFTLTQELENKKYDFIVNVWVCGYSGQLQGIAPTNCDVGVNLCVPPLIQISRIKNLANNKELIVPVFFNFWDLESIASSEKVIYSSEDMKWENFVEMESYWVEFVCSKFQIPRIILKVPIDKVWEQTRNFDFKKAKKLLAENIDYKKLVEKISEYLEKNNVGYEWIRTLQDIQEYQEFHKMTFAEKLIFQKLFNKYIVLIEEDWWDKFDDYFEKNKHLNKKDFFVKLEEIN